MLGLLSCNPSVLDTLSNHQTTDGPLTAPKHSKKVTSAIPKSPNVISDEACPDEIVRSRLWANIEPHAHTAFAAARVEWTHLLDDGKLGPLLINNHTTTMLTISPKQERTASSTAARDSASRTRRTHLVDVNTIKNSMHLHHEQTAISDIHDTPPASYRVAPKALRGQRVAPGRGTHPHLGRQRPVSTLTARVTSWSRRRRSRPPSRARIRLRLLFSLRGGSMPRSGGWRRPGRSPPARPTPPAHARDFPPVVRGTPRALPGSLRGLSDDTNSKGRWIRSRDDFDSASRRSPGAPGMASGTPSVPAAGRFEWRTPSHPVRGDRDDLASGRGAHE